MFKCLKCDEVVTDGSRICRKCGSILDEVPDPVQESIVMAEPVPEDDALGEEVETDPAASPAQHPIRTDVDGPADADGPADTDSPAETDEQWRCSHCSAEVPTHFQVCWRCQRPRKGTGSPEAVDRDTEPTKEAPVEAVLARATLICPKCSSDDLIPNARIQVVAGGRLQVSFEQDDDSPDSPGLLSAHACQRCGYVELRASKF